MVFAKVNSAGPRVGVVGWVPPVYAREPWWKSSERSRELLEETAGYIYEAASTLVEIPTLRSDSRRFMSESKQQEMIVGYALSGTFLVTGGTRGIGRAISVEFARAGACVIANYLRNETSAGDLEAVAKAENLNIDLCRADLTTPDGLQTNHRRGGTVWLIRFADLCTAQQSAHIGPLPSSPSAISIGPWH